MPQPLRARRTPTALESIAIKSIAFCALPASASRHFHGPCSSEQPPLPRLQLPLKHTGSAPIGTATRLGHPGPAPVGIHPHPDLASGSVGFGPVGLEHQGASLPLPQAVQTAAALRRSNRERCRHRAAFSIQHDESQLQLPHQGRAFPLRRQAAGWQGRTGGKSRRLGLGPADGLGQCQRGPQRFSRSSTRHAARHGTKTYKGAKSSGQGTSHGRSRAFQRKLAGTMRCSMYCHR